MALTGPSEELQTDKERLRQLREALHGAFRSLGHDKCGDWCLLGSHGHIYRDGSGWLLYVRCRSGMHWLTQDGDDEGCLHLDRLSSAAEADEIRQVIGLRQTTPPQGVSARHMPRISFHL